MSVGLLYFFIIVAANTVGAVSGMGGGVIIKPLMDMMEAHTLAEISFFSCTAVWVMSLVTTRRKMKEGVKFDRIVIAFIALGACLGGISGDRTLDCLIGWLGDDLSQQIQILITIGTLLFALLYVRFSPGSFHFSSRRSYCFCGWLLGFFASFLGIGGGPINVALLMLMFAMPIKLAVVYSISIILLSQSARLASFLLCNGLGNLDVMMLYYIVPAGICGGLLGSWVHKVSSTGRVRAVFEIVIIGVILLNLYNFVI